VEFHGVTWLGFLLLILSYINDLPGLRIAMVDDCWRKSLFTGLHFLQTTLKFWHRSV
jgi:hypothetical protein